jgi:hypothetical protein
VKYKPILAEDIKRLSKNWNNYSVGAPEISAQSRKKKKDIQNCWFY